MNSLELFFARVRSEWKFQYGVIRSIADWTIILYILIPWLAVLAMVYRSWWIETPQWLVGSPLSLFFLVGYLIAWSGSFRTFISEGDRVFLIKNRKLFLSLKQWGMYYTLIIQFLLIGFFTVMCIPFFIKNYGLTGEEIIYYFLLFFGLNVFLMYVKICLRNIQRNIFRKVIGIFYFFTIGAISYIIYGLWLNKFFLFLLLIIIVTFTVAIFYYKKTLNRTSLFDTQLQTEKEEKLKYISAIYQLSYEIEKTSKVSRSKPLFFRHSKTIFKDRNARNAYIELFIKIFIRNKSYWQTFLQMIFVTASALIIVPPIWIKVLLFGGFIFMLYYWLSIVWERIIVSHPLFKKYKNDDSYFNAKRKTVNAVISIAVIGLAVVVTFGMMIISSYM
ncbi:ABC transporter permease [Bacillus sp. 31A1R]|uniref:ABC transporter permease n=1 Tax=Robertmurraya mangrovi TaxID=3098077 RepID=A0ABU5IZJ4_9BACI|nr:ABC transporter permease [Bacillus sp. 31A1R]MDZ5472578.1 ABC transporter permease [Bacillus sp. 31A1R]